MKQDLIIGGISNYTFDKVEVWAKSINERIPHSVKRVVVAQNIDENTIRLLQNLNFEVHLFNAIKTTIYVARFVFIHEYLKNRHQEYNNVLMTDVRDVYFQKNPFPWIEETLSTTKKTIIAGSESIRYKNEAWGDNNLRNAYGEYVYELFNEKEIYNVGVLAGRAEFIKDLALSIYSNSVNRPIEIVDQAVFNVLANMQPYKNSIYFAPQYSGWCCHAGTTADPNKIDAFRPHLTEEEPIFDDGKIFTSLNNGKNEFLIVHQYDRVPLWNQFISQTTKDKG